MKILRNIFICVFVTGALFFLWRIPEQMTGAAEETQTDREEMPYVSEHSYYIKSKSGNVIVYNKDHTVYEFTDLDMEYLPDEVENQLIQGIYFRDQEDLYEFLETYSS